MPARLGTQTAAMLLLAIALSVCLIAPAVAADKVTPDAAIEQAIRDTAVAFQKAFDGGDAKAVAALWTAEGSLVDDQGRSFKGRKAIEDEYAAFFKSNPGTKIEMAVQSIEKLSPTTVVEDGLARVALKGDAPPVASRYTVVHVLVDGKWLMGSVRESSIELPSNYGRLEQFQWLIGTWETKGNDAVVRTTVRWLPGRSFLEREYTVINAGVQQSSGRQIIGWDPQLGRVRSWSFDSSGGYGSGLWAPVADGWVIESRGVLPDGTPTASKDQLVRVPGEDSVFGWKSTNRQIGDRPMPDLREVVLERLPEKQ